MIGKLWKSAVSWFEIGDLVPLLIIVSAVHYAAVLAGRDYWPVAVAIGLLVDLGHYRWVRAAARYEGGKAAQLATRWTFAIVMTFVSLAYHWRYYEGDLWLAVPIPLLIASLAWLAKVDRRTTTQAPQVIAQEAQAPRAMLYTCQQCEREFAKSQSLAAHMRIHANGHKSKVVV